MGAALEKQAWAQDGTAEVATGPQSAVVMGATTQLLEALPLPEPVLLAIELPEPEPDPDPEAAAVEAGFEATPVQAPPVGTALAQAQTVSPIISLPSY